MLEMHSQVVRLNAEALAATMLRLVMGRLELQKRSGLSHVTVWKACNANTISLASAKKISKALRTSVKSLLAESSNRSGKDDAKHADGWDAAVCDAASKTTQNEVERGPEK